MVGVQPDRDDRTWRSRLGHWENRGTLATMGTWRGVIWSAVIAVGVFQMSLPGKLIPSFLPSLFALTVLTAAAMLITPRNIRLPRVPWTVVAFLAVCAISVLWSITWRDTVRMTALYAFMALLACLWVAHSDSQVLLRGVAWGGLLIAIAVAVLVALDPSTYATALTRLGTALGPYGNRNSVSYALVLTLPAALMRTPRGAVARVESVLTVAAHLVWLAISGSATGRLGAVLIVVAFVVVRVLSRLRGRALVIGWSSVVAVAVVCLAAAAFWWDRILGLLGRAPDLSGRLELWAAIVDVWRVRPLLGYGFGAVWRYVWLPLDGSRIQKGLAKAAGFDAAQGHNVLFDLLPQLGLLGVAALLVLMGGLAYRGIVRLPQSPDAAGWALLTSIALVIVGSTEAGLIRPLGWFLVVAATAAVGRHRQPATVSATITA